MKKFFAMVLAVAMVMSMAAVSFAAVSTVPNVDGIDALDAAPLSYSADANTMSSRSTFQYGKAVYFPLLHENRLISSYDMVEGLKVKIDYEMGKDLVSAVSVVKKLVEPTYETKEVSGKDVPDYSKPLGATKFMPMSTPGKDGTEIGGYYYFVEIKLVAKETTSDADVVGTFELNKSKRGDTMDSGTKQKFNYKVKDLKTDFAINVSYENNYIDNVTKYLVDGDVGEGDLSPETYYLLKYNSDEEVEFTFGKEHNEGTFTVDVSGQGKNLLYFDTIIDDAIVAANPGAQKLFALNFNNTKFNRTGEFLYEGEGFNYAYQVMDDGSLVLLGEFNGEEVSFRTRVLGKYIFSDVELVAAPAAVEGEPVEVAPVDPVVNPGTGAAA